MSAVQWTVAAGSCRLNVGDTPVHCAYVNGIALLAFEHSPGWFLCCVTGHLSTSGGTLAEAQQRGIAHALKADQREADRRMTRKAFDALVSNPERLAVAP